MASILAALDGSGLERVVAQSTYGAQAGDALGDLSVLHELEEGLRAQPIPAAVIRGAYYMSNWDGALLAARDQAWCIRSSPWMSRCQWWHRTISAASGRACSLRGGGTCAGWPSARSKGPSAIRAMTSPPPSPQHWPARSRAIATPRDRWEETFRSLGFSAPAARSYGRMTAVSVDEGFETPPNPERGTTTLDAYVRDLVRRSS